MTDIPNLMSNHNWHSHLNFQLLLALLHQCLTITVIPTLVPDLDWHFQPNFWLLPAFLHLCPTMTDFPNFISNSCWQSCISVCPCLTSMSNLGWQSQLNFQHLPMMRHSSMADTRVEHLQNVRHRCEVYILYQTLRWECHMKTHTDVRN